MCCIHAVAPPRAVCSHVDVSAVKRSFCVFLVASAPAFSSWMHSLQTLRRKLPSWGAHPDSSLSRSRGSCRTMATLQAREADTDVAQPPGTSMVLRSLAAYPDARCTDGSPAGYYWSRGQRASSDWIVLLEPGGWCWDAASCARRRGASDRQSDGDEAFRGLTGRSYQAC